MKQGFQKNVKCFGTKTLVAYGRWNPSSDAVQTIVDAKGVTNITRSDVGVYAINLAENHKHLEAFILPLHHSGTNWDFIEPTSVTSRVVNVRTRTVAFASIGSGPGATDGISGVLFYIFARHTG